jgi:hypothetical protein
VIRVQHIITTLFSAAGEYQREKNNVMYTRKLEEKSEGGGGSSGFVRASKYQ